MTIPFVPTTVTICIVTYNNAHTLEKCLASLPTGVRLKIWDNASRDDTMATLKRLAPHAQVEGAGENLGFGAGHNRLLTTVTTPYVLLLNPDAQLRPNTLAVLVQALVDHPKALVVGPQHVGDDGAPHSSWKVDDTLYPEPANRAHIGLGPWPVGMISGACMLWRTEAIKALGGFDENIFLYFEDDDLCALARRAGGQVLWAPQAQLQHSVGASLPGMEGAYRRERAMAWSRLYVSRKHARLSRRPWGWQPWRWLLTYAKRWLLDTLKRDYRRQARWRGGLVGTWAFTQGCDSHF